MRNIKQIWNFFIGKYEKTETNMENIDRRIEVNSWVIMSNIKGKLAKID